MEIQPSTKLSEILEAYPWLPQVLEETDERAKPFLAMMDSPLAKRALRTATVSDAAKFLKRPPERLLSKLQHVIDEHEKT